MDNSYFEQNLLLSYWQSTWISGHDTGISNFNTLKNINIKVPVNRKLQLTSALWCISKWNGILNKGRGFIVVQLHSTSCSKQIHGWVGVVKNICLLRLTSRFTASGSLCSARHHKKTPNCANILPWCLVILQNYNPNLYLHTESPDGQTVFQLKY